MKHINFSGEQASERPNSLGMREEVLSDLLNTIDQKRTDADAKREFVRWPFRKVSVQVSVLQPGGGGSSKLKMACRNLSRGGMSLLHSAFMHPGSRVQVHLPRPDGTVVTTDGEIVRCTHLRAMVHEIGVRFTHPVDAKQFVQTDPMTDAFSLEKIDPELLKGTVVHLDDSATERKLLAHYLRGTSLRVRPAENLAEAFKLIGEGCDLLIVDMDMSEMNGVEVVAEIRGQGYSTPVILVTADTAAAAKVNIGELQVSALIPKPFTQETVLRAIAEYISADAGSRALCSSLPEGHPNKVLVDGYVQSLRALAAKVKECSAKDDAKACRTLALHIQGTAANYGYQSIGRLAANVAKSIAATGSVAETSVLIESLIKACDRAKP